MTNDRPAGATSRVRRIGFRIGAVLIGLALVGAAEGICRLLDFGSHAALDDPFVGFSDIHPLFVSSTDGTRLEIPPSRRKFFAAESFPAGKTPKTLRIFCLGGSTVQGRPWSKETSLTTWLQLGLECADPARKCKVVNCGGISYASYRLVPILRECLQYEPDLFVVCTGHNEFLEDRSYDALVQAGPMVRALRSSIGRSRLFAVAHQVVYRDRESPGERAVLNDEVDALLDYQNGLDAYRRDDAWHAAIARHFESNLRRMIAIARAADVPLILIHPPSNLRDTPPFKSAPDSDLTAEQQDTVVAWYQAASKLVSDNLPEAIRLLQLAADVDPRNARAAYDLGKCCESAGRYIEARRHFVRARDEDICPLRIPSDLSQRMRDVAVETETPLLDAHELLESRSNQGILGDGLLVDHIHPSFKGHQIVATELVRLIETLGLCNTGAGWQAQAESAWQVHFDRLDELYFLRGTRTLETLRLWAAGRADGPPIGTRRVGGSSSVR